MRYVCLRGECNTLNERWRVTILELLSVSSALIFLDSMLATLTSHPCAKSDDRLAPYSQLIKDYPLFRIYFYLLKLSYQ